MALRCSPAPTLPGIHPSFSLPHDTVNKFATRQNADVDIAFVEMMDPPQVSAFIAQTHLVALPFLSIYIDHLADGSFGLLCSATSTTASTAHTSTNTPLNETLNAYIRNCFSRSKFLFFTAFTNIFNTNGEKKTWLKKNVSNRINLFNID